MEWSVYMHIFPNGKKYIGMTSQRPTRRWKDGLQGYRTQTLILNAIREFGWENVEHKVICVVGTREEAEAMEIALIKEHRSNDPEYGYNIEGGGKRSRGYKINFDPVKRSEAHKGEHNWIAGKHLSPEYKAKLSAAHKGKKMNRESVAKSVAARYGEKAYNARKVLCYNKDGKLIAEYGSLADAGRAFGCRTQDVYNTCIGKQKSAKGIRFVYADNGR
jgi:group I intron endonuclease